MKALGSDAVPSGLRHCEIKFDGFRAVAVLNGGAAELWSRNRKALGPDFPEVLEELERLRCRNAVLDGEVVALDQKGRSRFQLLQKRGRNGFEAPVVYYVFDIMHRNGTSLVGLPLGKRREILVSLLGTRKGPIQLSPAFDVEPAELFSVAQKQGLEGIIVKMPGSLYEPDRRSGAWLKCKVLAEQEFVVGGFTSPRRSRQHFGALLLGYYEGRRLLYAGKVGTGFNASQLASLHARFLRAVGKTCPFANLPFGRKSRYGTGMGPAEMKSVTWLKPSVVAQIKFAEWTDEGLLRQPVFLGLRNDKPAARVRREAGPVHGAK
jgi:bifunctional non-homologous end joining protein LigD